MKSKSVWFFFPLGFALFAGILILTRMNGETLSTSDFSLALSSLVIQLIALLVIKRRPDNAVGWVLLTGALGMILSEFVVQWSRLALITRPGSLPLGLLAAWLSTWSWALMVFSFFVLLPLLFPTGRPLSPKWRPLLWFTGLEMALAILAFGLVPGPLEDLEPVSNPLGIQALAPVYNWIDTATNVSFLLLIGLALLSVVIRYRASNGEERAQMKWFLFAISLLFLNAFRGISNDLIHLFPTFPQVVEDWIFATNIILIALAIGIAILKYRLYEIDVIIRRTLIYGILTSILALVYFGSVLLMQSLLPSLTGQNSQITIVLSTLIIAALFSPLRVRIQSWIDRRFYRKKYNAERIIAAFNATLQDEVDPGQVTERLIAVVQETMQPDQVSIWLPDGGR